MSLFPKPLNRVIEPLMRPIFKSRGLAGTRILSDWPRIAGEELAGRATPEKLSFPAGGKTGGTLTIAVENGFALELQHLQPVIIERVNAYYGYQAVTRITISPRYLPRPEKPRAAPPRAPEPVLADADTRCVQQVADPELKSALQSLANSLSGKYN